VSVLRLGSVSKRYDGEVLALDDVDLRIDDGEFVAVVGPSGSGKSTLLHIAGTLETVTSGRVEIAGRDVSRLRDRDLSRFRSATLGFVFQQFYLLEHLGIVENVAQALVYRGVPARERRRRASLALERVGLGHRLGHSARALSGGERQRVAIARAVVGEPAIVLADEPTGNLDSRSGEAVMDLLQELHQGGATICMVTHDPRYARHAERGIHLFDGRVVEEPMELATV
jgi:putative ABC transport system ATP-binding protein